MKTIHRTILSLILATAAATAGAAPQEFAPAQFAQARQQFLAGVAGDASARDASIDAFHTMAASLPGHPILAVYEGAAVTLQARDAMMPWNKMTLAEKGANAIEKALAQLTPAHDEALFGGVPESIEVRLVAANTLLGLPDFMNRGPMAKRAIETALASPAFAHSPASVRAQLLFAAANVANKEKRAADEKALLNQVVALGPQSGQSKQAEARLKGLTQ